MKGVTTENTRQMILQIVKLIVFTNDMFPISKDDSTGRSIHHISINRKLEKVIDLVFWKE